MAEYLDHTNSPRLGQRPPSTSPNILRVGTDDDRPTNASHGQVAFVEDSGSSYIWDAEAAAGEGEWQPFGGGIEFYAQDDPPTSAGYGAFWLDTAP